MENEGAFTRRADRECACPREKETRRARLKLECPLECCWVVCIGWFSNRKRIERIKREGMREMRSLTDAREMLYVFRLIDHFKYFEFHLPQNFSITYYVFRFFHHFPSWWDYFLCRFVLAFPFRVSRNLFQIECVARSSTNRNDASPRERLLFTQLLVKFKSMRLRARACSYISTWERFILNGTRSLWYSWTVYIYDLSKLRGRSGTLVGISIIRVPSAWDFSPWYLAIDVALYPAVSVGGYPPCLLHSEGGRESRR